MDINITALQQMLCPTAEDDVCPLTFALAHPKFLDDGPVSASAHHTPATIGPKNQGSVSKATAAHNAAKPAVRAPPPAPVKQSSDIWSEEEVQAAPSVAHHDPRPRPE